jgi:hypothetical protein
MMLIMMMEYRSQLIILKSPGVFSSETHDSAGREVVRDASGGLMAWQVLRPRSWNLLGLWLYVYGPRVGVTNCAFIDC